MPPGSRVLDIGCGPGHAAAALVARGFRVTAVDPVPAMVEMTRERIARADVPVPASVSLGDAQHLSFADNTFRVVLALGVMEWLDSLALPMRELARVLGHGGWLIVSTDNRWAAHRLLDPALNPVLTPAKKLLRGLLLRAGLLKRRARARVHSIREMNRAAGRAGVEVVRGITLGFGPFSHFQAGSVARARRLETE